MRMKNHILVAATLLAVAAITVALAGQTAKPTQAPAGNGTLLDDLVVANRILANENILDGLGHVSVRSLQMTSRTVRCGMASSSRPDAGNALCSTREHAVTPQTDDDLSRIPAHATARSALPPDHDLAAAARAEAPGPDWSSQK